MELDKKSAGKFKFFIGKQEVNIDQLIDYVSDTIDETILSQVEQEPESFFQSTNPEHFLRMSHTMKKMFIRVNMSPVLISEFIGRLNRLMKLDDSFAMSYGGSGEIRIAGVLVNTENFAPLEFESRIKSLKRLFMFGKIRVTPVAFLHMFNKLIKSKIKQDMADKTKYDNPEVYEEYLRTPEFELESEIKRRMDSDTDEFLDAISTQPMFYIEIDETPILVIDPSDADFIKSVKEEGFGDFINELTKLEPLDEEELMSQQQITKPANRAKRFN